jgi:hypothetical protein
VDVAVSGARRTAAQTCAAIPVISACELQMLTGEIVRHPMLI